MTILGLMKHTLLAGALAISVGVISSCGDDGGGGNGTVDARAADDSDAASFTCDPVGAIPAVGALLNAPLDSDVEIIDKTPQHPGNPGPDNLP